MRARAASFPHLCDLWPAHLIDPSTLPMQGRVGRPMLTRSMAGGAAEPFVSLAERVCPCSVAPASTPSPFFSEPLPHPPLVLPYPRTRPVV